MVFPDQLSQEEITLLIYQLVIDVYTQVIITNDSVKDFELVVFSIEAVFKF